MGLPKRSASIITFFIFVLVAETVFSHIEIKVKDPVDTYRYYQSGAKPLIGESSIQWQCYSLFKIDQPQDVIFIGDSSCLMGIRPLVANKKYGLKAWNLGTLGRVSTKGYALLLRTYIERMGPPKVVVVHLAKPAVKHTAASIKALGAYDRVKNLIEIYKGEGNILWNLPSFRYRMQMLYSANAMKPAHLKAKRGKYPSDNQVHSIMQRNLGWLPENVNKELPPGKVVLAPKISEDALEGLKEIFDLSNKHGFTVALFYNPLPINAKNDKTLNAMKTMENIILKAASKYPHVVIPGSLARFLPADKLANYNHLTPKGAHLNTVDILKRIKPLLDLRNLR